MYLHKNTHEKLMESVFRSDEKVLELDSGYRW